MLPRTPRFLVRLLALALAMAVCPAGAQAEDQPAAPAVASPSSAKASKDTRPEPAAPAKPAAPAGAAAPASPPAAAAQEPAAAPAPPPPPTNPKLDAAKALISKKKYDDALKALRDADSFPDNTPAMKTDIALTRVLALLHKRRPDHQGARAIVLSMLHADPDGASLTDVAQEIRDLAREIRDSQPLIVHQPLTLARSDRPIRFRAQVRDNAAGRNLTLTLNYKPHDATSFTAEPFRKELNGYSALLRSPDALAPDGVSDDFLVDYYISASDPSGKVLDTNRPPSDPIVLKCSTEETKAAEMKAGINIDLVEHPPPPPPPPPAPPPPPPWYTRWYTITGAGAVVVGVTVGIVLAATHKEPLPANIGVLHVP